MLTGINTMILNKPRSQDGPNSDFGLDSIELSSSKLAFWRERVSQIGASLFIEQHVIRHTAFSGISSETSTDLQNLLGTYRNDTEFLAWLQTALDSIENAGKHLAPTAETINALIGLRVNRSFILRPRRLQATPATRQAQNGESQLAAAIPIPLPSTSWTRDTAADSFPEPLKYWYTPKFEDWNDQFSGGDEERCISNNIPWISNPRELADSIGVSTGELAWLSLHRPTEPLDHYIRFSRPKRNGGIRVISSPKRRLRVAQQWVLTNVIAPLHEQLVHDAAFGFRLGRSVADNASFHVAQPIVIRMDFENFFGNILFNRVARLFESFGYNEAIATILGILVTEIPWTDDTQSTGSETTSLWARRLPQGACTSPAITNILCADLDSQVHQLATSLDFRYTRYADDLVFSHSSDSGDVKHLIEEVRKISEQQGFVINKKKTKVMGKGSRQMVTGLVVNLIGPPDNPTPARLDGQPTVADSVETAKNHRVRPSRMNIRRFRALMHQCRVDGFDAVSKRIGTDARSYLHGYLSYIYMIDKDLFLRLNMQSPVTTAG